MLTKFLFVRGGESIDALLARFLKARAGDVDKAFALMNEDLSWREENSIHLLRSMSSREILEADKFPGRKQKHDEIFRHGFLGYDRKNRPIAYKWYNKDYLIPLADGLGIDELSRYNTWMVERMSGKCTPVRSAR